MRGRSSAAKPPAADAHHGDAPPGPGSGRLTRSRLWAQEEDLPFLDPPLEVDSQTPVADALIKRLKDEEEREGGWARSHRHTSSLTLTMVAGGPGSQLPAADYGVKSYKADSCV